MRIWLAQIGGGGTTHHIDELIALAHAYQDNLREAIRISYEVGPNEHQFTYALVINLPIDRTVVWVPYCSQNTTDYSGEGGAGRQRIEEALTALAVPVRDLRGTWVADNPEETDRQERELLERAVTT